MNTPLIIHNNKKSHGSLIVIIDSVGLIIVLSWSETDSLTVDRRARNDFRYK